MSSSTSPVPYVSAAQVPPHPVDDMEANPQDWYATSMPVAASSYDHYGFVNPYITPSVSSAGFSPIPEHAKSTGASMISYTSTAAEPQPTYPSASEAYSIDYSRPSDFPRLSIPAHLEYPHNYNLLRGNDNTHLLGFAPPFDSLPPRPRSSPSVFSPVTPGGSKASEHFAWPPASNALGISHAGLDETMFASSGQHQPQVLASSPPQSSSAPTPEMLAPQPRRMYAPIAPHPLSLQRLAATSKRSHDEDSDLPHDVMKRRKTSTSSSGVVGTTQHHELSEEDKLLLRLKDEENLPWKEIAARFQTDLGKNYQIPALQMRLKRLRERLRVWTDADLKALRMAHDYWRESKFEIIAAKMMEFGASDRWTAKQCARKWAEIDPSATPFMTTQEEQQQGGFTYTASPEASSTGYMPYMHMP